MNVERDVALWAAPDVMEVSGVLVAGESTRTLAYIKGRNGLSPRWRTIIILCSMVAIGLPVGILVSPSWVDALLIVEFTFLGAIAGGLLAQRLWFSTMCKALVERGQAVEATLAFRLSVDGLSYGYENVTMTARWPALTDVFRTRDHWVFLVQGTAMVLPRRFFATPEAERAFIAAAVARMSEPARGRSPDAAALAQG
ncbi:YcxB family protein [Sphingomonas sp. HF-S3]|uniref:YcxB family protein n=1 Tax=Sphingomonas rustica TaxID=3103142 RepID=A0ABV0BDL5_9SPHN